jgi:hypothetical protein
MISFKDATPHTEMVSLRHANKRVQRAVKCIDEDFLKSLSGGGKRKKKSVFPSYNTISTMAKGVLVGVAVEKYGKTAYNLYINKDQKAVDEQNKTCLKDLMTAFGDQNVLNGYNNYTIPQIRKACEPLQQQQQQSFKFPKTLIGGRGIFSFDKNHIIKEQKGSCSEFINEITCLYILKDYNITRKIIDSYVCMTSTALNSKVTYAFLVTNLVKQIATLDTTLLDFIKKENITAQKRNDIVSTLHKIFETLKSSFIHHTNLKLNNFIVDEHCNTIWVDSFRGAQHNKAINFNNNLLLFIEQNQDTDEQSKVSILMTEFKDSLTTSFTNLK